MREEENPRAIRLEDVLPTAAVDDLPDVGFGHAEFIGKRLLGGSAGCVAPADLAYSRIVKFRAEDHHSSGLAALADLVRMVIAYRSQEEMIGADASANVATVQDLHTIRDGAEVQFPGETMGGE